MAGPKRPKADEGDVRIGDRVRIRRLLLGMSQQRLGEALGVSFQQVQKYEKGKNRISASRLRQVAGALDVPVTHFYDAGGEPNAPDSVEGAAGGQPEALTPDALRVARAFERIGDKQTRENILALVEGLGRRS